MSRVIDRIASGRETAGGGSWWDVTLATSTDSIVRTCRPAEVHIVVE